MASQFEINQLARLETLLTSYLDAITALLTANVQEYQLNTGQGTQRVTRYDISNLQKTYGQVWQQYDALSARCSGGGVVTVVPYGAAPWLDRL